ncbi:hypothetical protein ElyMa_000849900 [Elysia marginata]|uniref:Uncharacterized protein n=1 Tax=Elysia marginata TaxID=1093978 RepID=A0AAV4H1V9_9GAST|nr:hypothetical protein ElyMa_000849900 [Elysia marginata]
MTSPSVSFPIEPSLAGEACQTMSSLPRLNEVKYSKVKKNRKKTTFVSVGIGVADEAIRPVRFFTARYFFIPVGIVEKGHTFVGEILPRLRLLMLAARIWLEHHLNYLGPDNKAIANASLGEAILHSMLTLSIDSHLGKENFCAQYPLHSKSWVEEFATRYDLDAERTGFEIADQYSRDSNSEQCRCQDKFEFNVFVTGNTVEG